MRRMELLRTMISASTVFLLICLAGKSAAQSVVSAPPDNPIGVIGPSFWAISVEDLEISTQWYGRVFEAVTLRDVTLSADRGAVRILRSGPLVIELIHRPRSTARADVLAPGAHDFDMRGHVKAGVFVTDARSLHERWLASGLRMDRRVVTDTLLNALTFVLRDPDGNRVQVFETLP